MTEKQDRFPQVGSRPAAFPESTPVEGPLLAAHYPTLDGLRAVSISFVVFAHLTGSHRHGDSLPLIYLNRLGTFGVYVFFVISGFLITSLLLKERMSTGRISLRAFYLRRVLRIFPLAFAYIAVVLVLNQVLQLNIPWQAFAGAALFMGNLPYFKTNWYFGHYWSLSMEEQYYLVFPFLLKKFTNLAHLLVIGLIVGVVGIRLAFELGILKQDNAINNAVYTISSQCDGVLIGSLASLLAFRYNQILQFIAANRRLLALPCALLAMLIFVQVIPLGIIGSTISSALIAVFILSQLQSSGSVVFRLLNHPSMILIGKLSFSIYIWQQLFLYGDSKLSAINTLPQNVILLGIVSYCSYYFYERKFLRIKDRISARRARKLAREKAATVA